MAALALAAASAPARAECDRPFAPEIPAASAPDRDFAMARARVSAYLSDLDTYMSCMKNEAAGLSPLDAWQAYRAYDKGFGDMQEQVDEYDAALAAHAALGDTGS